LKRRTWATIVIGTVAAGFAIRFGFSFPWTDTMETLAGSDWLLLSAAAAGNLVSLAAKAGGWWLLLRRISPLRLKTAQAATFVGAAVNSISISVSGEAARAQYAAQHDAVPFSAAAVALGLSRVVEAIGLVVFLAVAFVALPPWPGARGVGLVLALAAASLAWGYRLVPWNRLGSGTGKRWYESFVQIAASKDYVGLASAVGLGAFNWFAQWFTYHWSILATHTPTTPAVSLSALVMANLAGILRVTPGNIGVMQGSIILGMHAFKISAANALAAGLVLQAVQVLPVLVIGIGLMGTRGFRKLARRGVEAT
jgi:putative heme transporter